MRRFWKLSMGKGAASNEFNDVAAVRRWTDQGLVLVYGPTGRKGGSRLTQGEEFRLAHVGDLFYLCHGNDVPGILLLGEFIGHAEPVDFPEGRNGWYARKFTELLPAPVRQYSGPNRWWTPNHFSTFVGIDQDALADFEQLILQPYFGVTVAAILATLPPLRPAWRNDTPI